MLNWRQNTKNKKVELYSRGDIVKDDSGFCSIHWTRIISITNDSSDSHGYHLQTVWLRRTSSWRNTCYNPSKKWRMLPKIWKFQYRSVQTFGFFSRHKWPKSWSTVEDPVVSSWAKPVRSSFSRTNYGKGNLRKILLQHGWEKVSDWECLFVHHEKGLFLSVCVDDIKLAGKKQNINPMWKVLNKEADLREPTSFLDHVYLGCTQRQCQISKDIVDNYRTMFESRISAGVNWKTLILWEFSYFFVVLWYGRSCEESEEMCGAILWGGKQDDSTTLQSIYSMHRWPPL